MSFRNLEIGKFFFFQESFDLWLKNKISHLPLLLSEGEVASVCQKV